VFGHSINPRFGGREVIVLAGSVLAGIASGVAGMMVSVAYGHPPAVSLLLYSLSGCCGMMAFALMSARTYDV
jgi:hypothetical protein